jgi:pilus assembly protein CpaF
MFAIVVNEKGGEQKRLEFDKPEVTIGRVQGNDIILPKGNVSKRHSRIVLKDGKFIIVDLKSTNGTYVNGRKITSPLVVKGSDKIYIGDFILSIEEMQAAGMVPPGMPGLGDEPPPPPPRKMTASIPPPPPRRPAAPMDEDLPPSSDGGDEEGDAGPPSRPMAPAPLSSAPALPVPGPVAVRPTLQQNAVRSPMEGRPPSLPSIPRPAPAPAPAPRPAPAPVAAPAAARPEPLRRPSVPARPAAVPAVSNDRRVKVVEVLQKAAARLASGLPDLAEEGVTGRVERAANEALEELRAELPQSIDIESLARDLAAEVLSAGPLDDLMDDDGVSEISVPRFDRIFADRGGMMGPVPRWFSSPDAVVRAAEKMMLRAGRAAELDLGRATGLVEARLENGWVLRAALPPLSARGASLTLRRPQRANARIADLVGQGFLSQGMADFLDLAIKGRRNLVISGPSGSGRTTLISALLRAAEGARLVSVEESEELDLGEGPWTPLVGVGERARQAIGLGLRMRPDHLVVGDVRGPEAFDLVAAMAGGADGIICAVTAGSARDAVVRLAQLARLAPEAPEVKVLSGEIARGVHVVVHLGRSPDGEPRVVEVVDNTTEGGEPIFTFKAEGGGRFAATGHVPAWAEGASPAMFRG